jgi:hypothetical protein
VRGRFYRPIKQAVSLRLDADVIEAGQRISDAGKQHPKADDAGRYQAGLKSRFRSIMKTRRPRKRIPAEAIARNADQGSDVSRFFTNTGRMRQGIPAPSAPEKPRRSSFSARAQSKSPT